MRVVVLARGGLAVYGGYHDPGRGEVVVNVADGETVALEIEYPSAPSAMTKTEAGIASTSPTVSGSVASCTLSGVTRGGYVDISATVGGATRIIRVRGQTTAEPDQYES